MKYLIFLLIGIFMINLVLAVNCNPSSVTLSYNKSETKTFGIYCSNPTNSSIQITKTGDFSISDSIIGMESSKNITITFNPNANVGLNSGTITFSDSTTIPLFFNVIEHTQNPTGVIVFPTAKVINIQQGQKKNQNIQLIVPQSYQRSITIQSVSMNPDLDVIGFGDLDLGILNPGQTLNIPIIIDATNVQIGNYNTQINILATDSQGQVQLSPSNLQIVVSLGINPSNNGTFNTRPICSLSSLEFNLNQTGRLTCNNVVENIEVSPIYNEYFEGLYAGQGAGTYTYEFKLLKHGTTNFLATFNYKDSPLFSPFQQEIRISPSGNSPVSGTQLKVLFYQRGTQIDIANLVAGETILNIVDNKTDTLVNSYSILMGGLPTNNSINLEPNKNYNLRISSPGFVDLTLNFTVLERKLDWTINPLKEFYIIGDVINISSEFNDTSFLANDVVINNPKQYVLPMGNITIKAVKEGYQNSNKTIIVKDKIYIVNCFPDFDDWTKGDEVACDLNIPSEWEAYVNDVLLEQGNGKNIKFKIKDYGTIKITAEEKVLNTKIIEKKPSNWNPLNWGWVKSIGMWWLLIIAVVIVVFVYYNKKEETSMGFATNITHPGG